MHRQQRRGPPVQLTGVCVGCCCGLGVGVSCGYWLGRPPAPPPPAPPPRRTPAPPPDPPPPRAERRAAAEPPPPEPAAGRGDSGGGAGDAGAWPAGIDPESEVMRPHHRGDGPPRPVRFEAPEATSGVPLPVLPRADELREWDASCAAWAAAAQPGDYPEPLTTGQVARGACGWNFRFGGSPDSKSPTGWVICESDIPSARRWPQPPRPRRHTRAFPGDCRTGPGGTCMPRPRQEEGPPGAGGDGAAPCVVYSFGVGEEDSFEQHLAHDTSCEVHAFDPVPAVREWAQARDLAARLLRGPSPKPREVDQAMSRILEAQGVKRTGSASWWRTPLNGGYYVNMAAANEANPVAFHPWGLAQSDGEQRAIQNSWSRGEAQQGTFRSFAAIMQELGHKRVDIVKLDVETAEWSVLEQLLDPRLGIRQLLVEMHFGGAGQWVTALRALRAGGFRPFHAERLRYHGRGCRKSRVDPKCRGALQEVAFIRDWGGS
eukprot:TRINITY_DN7935_c3_g1_i1.p1 TRINITY_DN7935_c3_g1~~TRINITY_DN7935_c3_g1_i1.p1  ORF type:complete len:488 (+),score=121.41 TRINITY_DN7935_c3_g1_i1:74-1537(+)